MTLIVSSFKVIESHVAIENFKWRLKAVAANPPTITDGLLKGRIHWAYDQLNIEEFKSGRYQVAVTSPEACKNANKLRGVTLLEELENIWRITIVDEAHIISIWGGSRFWEDLECVKEI
ncbi:hypothetical protein FRC12_024951 [Ceratobasidium sp. 428]|nr:hypothetical protein FRC12_024951 [Ceratobasidium sp. 428]